MSLPRITDEAGLRALQTVSKGAWHEVEALLRLAMERARVAVCADPSPAGVAAASRVRQALGAVQIAADVEAISVEDPA